MGEHTGFSGEVREATDVMKEGRVEFIDKDSDLIGVREPSYLCDGWGLHPRENAGLSRPTPAPDIPPWLFQPSRR